jgi:solute carrier family 25 (adenine nucleotide translocator) protein 4/5/6/31
MILSGRIERYNICMCQNLNQMKIGSAVTCNIYKHLYASVGMSRYTGIMDCLARIMEEQGVAAFWNGIIGKLLRHYPTTAFHLAFKDRFKSLFPKYDPKTQFYLWFAANMAEGTLSGAAALALVYPLEFVHTRLACDVAPAAAREFRGTLDCLASVAARAGVGALYSGFGVAVLGIAAFRAAYFLLLDGATALVRRRSRAAPGPIARFCLSEATNVAAGLLTYPIDTVRRRLIAQAARDAPCYAGAADCLARIVREEGPAALFKGAAANVARSLLCAAVLVAIQQIVAGGRPRTAVKGRPAARGEAAQPQQQQPPPPR